MSFYKNIAKESHIRTPHCYYGAFDEETGNSLLLLEDLQGGYFGEMINGVSGEKAEFVIEHLVPFHVTWWENPDLQSMEWVPTQPLLDDPDKKREMASRTANSVKI